MSFTVNNSAGASVAGPLSLTVTISIPAGHTVGVWVQDANSVGTLGAITDTGSNPYTKGTPADLFGIWVNGTAWSIAIANPITSVTYSSAASSGSGDIEMFVWDVTATGTITANDSQASASFGGGVAGTDNIVISTLTITSADGLILAGTIDRSGNSPTAGTGFTLDGTAGGAFSIGEHRAITSSAGATFTDPGSSGFSFLAAAVAFQVSGGGGISGSAAIIEGSDTVAGTGKTTIVGTAAISEGADTAAGTGVTTIVGTAAITEGADAVTGAGVTTIVGSAAITEGADTVSASGTTTIVASAAIVEGVDTVTASGTTTVVGSAAITEDVDTVTASGTVGTVTGSAAITEGVDTVTASGSGANQIAATDAGRSKRRRRQERFIVRIDGQEFVCSTREGVQEVLRKARELAASHALVAAERQVLTGKPLTVTLPKITGPAPLRKELAATKVEVGRIYTDAFRDAEIRMLMQLSARKDDDEDVLWMLM